MYKYQVEEQLTKLLELVNCSNLEKEVDKNVSTGMTVWKLFGKSGQCGQAEARFGSEYPDQPDGYAFYLEGYNWTDYCPTVEQCAAQHKERIVG